MFWGDRRQRARAGRTGHELTPSDLTWQQSLLIGFFQCLSLWPGMSRSMMVILGGYFVGLRPARAAEFSFLLGLITLTAAAGYKMLGTGKLVVAAFGFAPLAFGGVVAAVAAAISVRWLVGYLTRHGLALFAWYRIVLAAAVVWLLV
jgi:undecaprenyl-diphosphatase